MRLHVDGFIYGRQSHGGIRRVFDNLLPAVALRGDVEVVLHLPPDSPGDGAAMRGVRSRVTPRAVRLRPGRVFSLLNTWLSRRAARRYWARLGGGVFQSTYYTTHRALRIPQVATIQDMIYEEFPEFFRDERARRHIADKAESAVAAAALVFPSEASRGAASKWYAFGSRPTAIIPYALDDVFRATPQVSDVDGFKRSYAAGEAFVLHTGSRYLHKNFGFLLRAFAAWPGRARYRLVAVGGDVVTPAEAETIASLGMEGRVTVIPALDRERLVLAYHAASAFVCPSLSEGYGFPLLEAMACGVPVVALRAGSLPEVGQDVPLWVSPGDLGAMVESLDEAVRRDARCESVGRGIRLARQRTWDDVADDYVRVYRVVAEAANS